MWSFYSLLIMNHRNKSTLFIFLSLSFLFSSDGLAQLQINEIMYDPGQCSDSYCEWVELFNNGSTPINISECSLNGKELSGVIEPQDYLLAVRNERNFSQYFGNISSANKIIELSFSLKNTGDNITLTGNGNCSDTVDYSSFTALAAGNNKSLEKREDHSWGESLVQGGTPGQQNSIWDLSVDYNSLEITEILPNPFGEEDAPKPNGEWVELYNNGEKSVDLQGLMLKDETEGKLPIADNKVTGGTIICGGCYKVVYRDGDSDFALNQDYEVVRLFAGDTILDSVSYSGSTEGMSWSKLQGEWYGTVPTPGAENKYVAGCDWDINIQMENKIFTGTDLNFTVAAERIYGFPQNITVRGTIEDVFGEVVKEYTPWTNDEVHTSASKQYSPNLKEDVYQISFWFENLSCADNIIANNKAAALVAINPQYKQTKSSLAIEEIYLGNDEEAEWGDQFRAKVNIYKGYETKYSVQLWAERDGEKISKTTTVNIDEKYKYYPLTLPVQLEPNCNQKIEDGTAQLVLDAFGLQTKKEFTIAGEDSEVCKDYLTYVTELAKEEEKQNLNSAYEIIEFPSSIEAGGIFRIKVQLLNDKNPHSYEVWSYLYRGNKCYSCQDSALERDEHKQKVTLRENEAKILEFLLKADEDMEEGEYKLKVSARKDEQKTTKDLIVEIPLLPRKDDSVVQLQDDSVSLLGQEDDGDGENGQSLSPMKEAILPTVQGITVYQSSSEKARQLIPFILATTFGLLCLVFIGQAWQSRKT